MSSAHGDGRPPGPDRGPGSGPGGGRPVSALPSVQARALAFTAILVAGLCGGLIGYGFVGLQCQGSCATPDGIGGLTGAVIAAGGVAIVAVLTLRAMGEWRTIKEDRALAEAAEAARAGAEAWAPPAQPGRSAEPGPDPGLGGPGPPPHPDPGTEDQP